MEVRGCVWFESATEKGGDDRAWAAAAAAAAWCSLEVSPQSAAVACSSVIPLSALGCCAKCHDGNHITGLLTGLSARNPSSVNVCRRVGEPPRPRCFDTWVNGGGGISGHPVRKTLFTSVTLGAFCFYAPKVWVTLIRNMPGAAANTLAGK